PSSPLSIMRFLSFLLLTSLLATIAFGAECPPNYTKACSVARKECIPKCWKKPASAFEGLLPFLDLCPEGKDWTCQQPTECVCR
ncbi:hypothetical protein PENTCL1PPCAC_11820, partial [Pristionchus entomophagus]